MTDLNTQTLTTTLKQLRTKEISHAELSAALQTSVDADNKRLNIFLTMNDGQAVNSSKADLTSPLAGIPIALKDNISTKGIRTTASSTVLDSYIPVFDAKVAANLKAAGGVIQGKTNLDAWAHGSSTETSQYGRTLNPRNPKHLPGGSSGGSAAAVAANMCIAAIGTETAGSIRQPAAWCGVVGIKPTYGRVSRAGIAAMASSTDSPGPMTKTVEDGTYLLNYLAGKDPHDATTSAKQVPDFTKALHKDIKGLKIGYVYHDLAGMEATNSLFATELKVFERLGAHVEPTIAMDPHHAVGVYTVVQRGEVSSNLARYDGVRLGNDRSFFGPEAKRRIMLGTFTLSKGYSDQYYVLAQKVRTLFIQDYERLFKKYDVLVALSSPGFAKKIGATDGAAMFGELEDMLLEPSSIAGLPGVNVPCYQDTKTNLYLGMNIMAPMWREDLAIQVAHAYEQATNWSSWK
jgi:aspartyl-tRNA(Asn)/glutamyl-tRNA(Gln) amidotransferase subunit A